MTAAYEELTRVIAALPAERVQQVLDYARSLAGPDEPDVEYGDLTDDDKRAVALAAFRRFDEEHPDEDWGEDLTRPGEPICPPPAT